MKICIDARWLKHSGIGTYLSEIIPKLIILKPNYHFTVLGNTKSINEILPNNISNITIVDFNAKMYSLTEQVLYSKVIPVDTDLYISTHFNIPLFYSKKIITIIYDLYHLANIKFYKNPLKFLYSYIFFKRLTEISEKIICISNFTKSELVKYTNIDSNKVIVIHLGVSEDRFKLDPRPPLYNSKYILFIGNFKPNKNLKNLILSFSLISDLIPHSLILVGKYDGFITNDNDVLLMIQDNSKIMKTGLVPYNDLKNFIQYADLLVFPSTYEGFGFPPLEAMALGCSTAISDIEVLREVCDENTIYFDPLNPADISKKILLLLNDTVLKESMIESSKSFVRKYNWDNTAHLTVQLIDEVLSK